jgi:hypothetical protein
MPTVRAVHDTFQTAVDKKLADLDMTAVIKLWPMRNPSEFK